MTPDTEIDRLFAEVFPTIPAPDGPATDYDCDVCEGRGHIDETLGGYAFSNPRAECPQCDGRGWFRTDSEGEKE